MKAVAGSRFTTSVFSLIAGILFCMLVFTFGVTQDVPIGQLEGVIFLKETGKPLAEAQVNLSVHGDDTARDRYVTADEKGRFKFHNVRAGDYDLNVSASEHTSVPKTIQVTEGKPTHVDLGLEPNKPYLKLYASQRVWMPQETPQLELHGFRTGDRIKVEVESIDFNAMLHQGKFNQAIQALRTDPGLKVPTEFENFAISHKISEHAVKNRDKEGAFVDRLDLNKLPEGFYWVKCSCPGINIATYVNVSRIGLVTKTSGGNALGYVVDLYSGKPISGATLWTQRPGNDTLRSSTGADGTSATTYSSIPGQNDNRTAILATYGNSIATIGIYSSGESDDSAATKIVLYTDRPVYRPGDEVQFKGIVRQKNGRAYKNPSAGPIEVVIKDTEDQPMQKMQVQASAHGAFWGHFTTSKEAGPGLYRISASGLGGSSSHFVDMLAYRKPEMNVQFKPLKPLYAIGDKVQVEVQCSYYFGGPVVGAKVRGYVFSSPAWNSEPGEEDQNDGRSFGGGEVSKSYELTTDGKGRALLEFDTRQADNTSIPLSDLNFNVNASVSDESNKYADGSTTIHVYRGSVSLDVACQNYLAKPGQMVELILTAQSNLGARPPVPGLPVKVTIGREEWTNNKAVTKLLSTLNVLTGSDGKLHMPVTAIDRGTMVITADAVDSEHHTIRSEDRVTILSDNYHAESDQSKFEVVLDKRHYKLGETANVLLRTLVPGGSALVTLQSDKILWKKVVPLQSSTTILTLPVAANYAPNCFVSVAYIKKKKFYEGSAQLSVDPSFNALQISVSSDRAKYEPGETVRLTVRTKSPSGAPVPAEVSLGIVDESIYAIRSDSFNVQESFYPKRNNSVTTSYSFSEVYLDGGDKGGTDVKIRRKFRDTAAWIPSIQTDATGEKSVSFVLPDNLTEWRATAVGVTDSTLVGKATTHFKSRKLLMARLELPDFLVQQDQSEMALLITNDTGADKDVHVRLNGTGVGITGELQQTVHVSTDRLTSVNFKLKAGNPGPATITARTWIDGGPSDGVEQKFQVNPHGLPVQAAWADEIQNGKNFDVMLDPAFDRTVGSVKVEVSASLVGSMINALDGLIGFPYGCVEQTMSRFMPSILVKSCLNNLGLHRPNIENQIPQIARDSMTRLSRMQHADGGWGWWENDASDPLMTALVLDGLDRCQQAGYPVQKVDSGRAIEWCLKRIGTKAWKADSLRAKSYVIYVLARFGKTKAAVDGYNTLILHKASDASIATLVMATHAMGPSMYSSRDTLLSRLIGNAHQGPLGAYWSNSDEEWGSETTALSLAAICLIRPDDPVVPRAVRHLMLSRRGAMWDSTRDTSYSLVALSKYLSQTKTKLGAFTARVLVNDRLVKSISLDATQPDKLASMVQIPISELHSGPNTVRIERSGLATCYATVQLSAVKIQDEIAANSPVPALRVSREYFLMETRKLEDGTLRLLPSRKPIQQASSGDVIRVNVTVESSIAREFLMVEDPIPSNCRISERDQLTDGEQWSYWWDRTVILDDRIAFFIHRMSPGKQVLTYTMRAERPGESHALPPSLTSMYDLTVRASGAESHLEVK